MSNSSPAIQAINLSKKFGSQEVLRGIDLEVPAGSIFGLLGLNGMGKTTLIRTLLGLLRPDGGECRVEGIDPVANPLEARRRIGYMAENPTMYGWMDVGQIIKWVGSFYPTWDPTRAEELRKKMRLDAKVKVGSLSKGQTSRLAILLALAHRPATVILDDPILGLDPIARRDLLRDVIVHLQGQQVTVFFSSHLLYEIEPICDRVAILHHGKIIQTSTVERMKENIRKIVFQSVDAEKLASIPGLLDIQQVDGQYAVTVENFEAARPRIAQLTRDPMEVLALSMDEAFEAYVTGRREVVHV
ncbi:MAG: ABC transporter ATP-binding protein [Verrucomicrobia bacterium]|nr:ABC transporter ATP-binding protein [Verrucomicrobiota bacterium]